MATKVTSSHLAESRESGIDCKRLGLFSDVQNLNFVLTPNLGLANYFKVFMLHKILKSVKIL